MKHTDFIALSLSSDYSYSEVYFLITSPSSKSFTTQRVYFLYFMCICVYLSHRVSW